MGDKTLRFIPIPFVHWPDTMMTELAGEGLLFTSDMFGSHGASKLIYYDENPDQFELRDYYASILMVYSNMVVRALRKVEELSPKLIAPAHGALHREIATILKLYERWVYWSPLSRGLVVVGSQYGKTEKLARAAADGMKESGLKPIVLDSAAAGPDDLLADTLEAAAVIIATTTHNGKPFPGVTFYLDLLEEVKPKRKVFAVIGCYGWSGGGVRTVKKRLEEMKLPVFSRLEVKGPPALEDLQAAKELGKRLGERAREEMLV